MIILARTQKNKTFQEYIFLRISFEQKFQIPITVKELKKQMNEKVEWIRNSRVEYCELSKYLFF